MGKRRFCSPLRLLLLPTYGFFFFSFLRHFSFRNFFVEFYDELVATMCEYVWWASTWYECTNRCAQTHILFGSLHKQTIFIAGRASDAEVARCTTQHQQQIQQRRARCHLKCATTKKVHSPGEWAHKRWASERAKRISNNDHIINIIIEYAICW